MPRKLAEFWRRLSPTTRSRASVAAAAVAVVAIVVLLIVPALPCSFPGGDSCEADAGEAALALVPGNAIAYVHADLDRSTDRYAKAAAIASRTPLLTQQIGSVVLSQFLGGAGGRSNFSKRIPPWLGSEALVATLSSDDGGGQVQMLQIADQKGAQAYARSIAAAKPKTSVYRGVGVSVDRRGLATAVSDGFLLIGREAGVRAVIDVASDAPGSSSIEENTTASRVHDELPGDAIVDAYVARLGLAGLFGEDAPLAPAAQFVDPASSNGFGAAVVATDDGLELSTRSSLGRIDSPAGGGGDRNVFAGLPEFDPKLAGRVQGDALAYVGIGDPESTLQGLLKSAGRQAPGFLGDLSRALRRLGKGSEVDLSSSLLPTLGDEAAFALIPRVDAGAEGSSGQSEQTLPPGAGAIPYIEFLADVSDEAAASDALAKLQPAIAKALGERQPFKGSRLGGVTAQALRISPQAQVAYAVFDSLLVFATDPAGVRTSADPEGQALGSTELYQRATEGLDAGSSLLAFFNIAGLLRFAEASGQAANPAYATFAPDLRKLQGLALSVDASEGSLDTDSRLLIAADAGAQAGGE